MGCAIKGAVVYCRGLRLLVIPQNGAEILSFCRFMRLRTSRHFGNLFLHFGSERVHWGLTHGSQNREWDKLARCQKIR
jgi:hypothetical protein